MAAGEIRVHAMFPTPPEAPQSRWNWVHSLTFPLETLKELWFTPTPYKWIRYATGVVVGARGHLSTSRDQLERVSYNLLHPDLPSGITDLFYHLDEGERARMFPIDPEMGQPRVSSSTSSRRDPNFPSAVKLRDKGCVLSRWYPVEGCIATHLVPHSKGNEYIETYTRRRSQDPDENDIICTIDDSRNGILLNKVSHDHLNKDIALLVTPNFAMTTADIDPTVPPAEYRCTMHIFDPEKEWTSSNPHVLSGSPAVLPPTLDNWPPDIIFDAVYATVVLRYFAAKPMADALRPWKPVFYPGGPTTSTQAENKKLADDQTNQHKQADTQAQSRAARHKNRARRADDELDYFDCLMILPYILMQPDVVQASWREAAEKKAEMEHNVLEDRVLDWQEGVTNAE